MSILREEIRSFKRDARNCQIRHELMRIVVGLDHVPEKKFDKLVQRFKRKKLFASENIGVTSRSGGKRT